MIILSGGRRTEKDREHRRPIRGGIKQAIKMNSFTKEKQTHKLRKRLMVTCVEREVGVREGEIRLLRLTIHNNICTLDNHQGPTA